MVEIIPFKGIIYNNKKIEKLDTVMSPPYDIISDDMQDELYKKHPYNFVRLILGKRNPDDNEKENRYTRAKEFFEKWNKELILIQDEKPCIYPYKIEYKIKNKIKTMNGLFLLLKIDPNYTTVKAHEKTLSKPKADRLNLVRACHANLEPIQLLYIDEGDILRKKLNEVLSKPLINVTGYDGFKHRLWKIDDEKLISFVQNQLKDRILFIADGHHRYQTSINYANEVKEKTGNSYENASFNYIMVILANMFDKGLSILPTHRLIKKSDIDFSSFLNDLETYFDIDKKKITNKNTFDVSKKIKQELETKYEHKFVMFLKNNYYVLTLKDEKIMDDFAQDRSKTWRTLDVSILHKIILEHLLKINQDNLEDHVNYTRVDEEAIKFVYEDKFDLSFLMNATKIEELKAIADAGEHMPQKSTYFLPKMLSGLVMYKM